MGLMVICCFRPKPGKESELEQVVADHLPVLRSQGFATDRPAVAMRASDGTIVEVFEWVSAEAVAAAHSNPEVGKLWERYFAASTAVPYGELAEARELFPNMTALSVEAGS
jgi:hypothetical protein